MSEFSFNTGSYGIELHHNHRDGWCGTFAVLVRTAAADILSDHEDYGPVEVTWSNEGITGVNIAVGVLDRSDDNTIELVVQSGRRLVIEIEDVLRFRA